MNVVHGVRLNDQHGNLTPNLMKMDETCWQSRDPTSDIFLSQFETILKHAFCVLGYISQQKSVLSNNWQRWGTGDLFYLIWWHGFPSWILSLSWDSKADKTFFLNAFPVCKSWIESISITIDQSHITLITSSIPVNTTNVCEASALNTSLKWNNLAGILTFQNTKRRFQVSLWNSWRFVYKKG